MSVAGANDPAERPGTVSSLALGVLFDLVRILGDSSLDIETVIAEITGGRRV